MDDRISVGILYSVASYLKLLGTDTHRVDDFHQSFARYGVAQGAAVFDVLANCGLVVLSQTGSYKASAAGNRIAQASNEAEGLRILLRAWLDTMQPTWLAFVPRGRGEVARYLPKDVRQALYEAGLFSSNDENVVAWWDDLSQAQRASDAADRLDTGRFGERLSLRYERLRTGAAPVWKAIESNLVGYDILSRVSATDARPLRIEVKASDAVPEDARFIVTRREWEESIVGGAFCFYLWILRPSPTLCILDPDTIGTHMAADRGAGKWVRVEVLQEEALFSFDDVSEQDLIAL